MSIANVITRGYGPSAGVKWIVTQGFFDASGPVSAVVSGSATSQLTAAKIVAGTETIILTLTNATWAVAAGSLFDNQRQNIIDGMNSAGVEGNGWNVEVRDKEVVTAVVRTSDTEVTITLTAAALYSVTTSETVTITIPASAISDDSPVVAGPTINAGVIASTGGLWSNPNSWFFFND